MRKVLSLAILAIFLTAGCRRSEGPAQPQAPAQREQWRPSTENDNSADPGTPATPPVSANDHRRVLVCFGDSLTAGYGTEPGQSYPDYLQKDLDHLHYGYRIVNEGVSGNTTKDGVARLPEVLALHPDIVVVEFGGNDGLRGLPNEDTRANLDQIVGTLQHAGIKVALAGITLPPDYGADYIRQFDETYTAVAGKYHVPMIPFLLKDVYGSPGMMQGDETHATAKGNEVVARNVLDLVTPLLRK